MSQKDLLQNQVIEEILREKSSYYNVQNKTPDYWVVISPYFLKDRNLTEEIRKTSFFKNQKDKIVVNPIREQSLEFYGALVSLDEDFMNWMQLRLGYFERIESVWGREQNKSKSESYVSDGVCGSCITSVNDYSTDSFLLSNTNFLHPDIITQKLSDSIKNFY
jgi:hypothetical protein